MNIYHILPLQVRSIFVLRKKRMKSFMDISIDHNDICVTIRSSRRQPYNMMTRQWLQKPMLHIQKHDLISCQSLLVRIDMSKHILITSISGDHHQLPQHIMRQTVTSSYFLTSNILKKRHITCRLLRKRLRKGWDNHTNTQSKTTTQSQQRPHIHVLWSWSCTPIGHPHHHWLCRDSIHYEDLGYILSMSALW